MSSIAAFTEGLRKTLERSARRYHERMREENHHEHRFWKFEHCPGPACVEARSALNITDPREPGAEG